MVVLIPQIYLNKPAWQFWIVLNYSLNLPQNKMNITTATICNVAGVIFNF
ncbi:MAG: hypothetical protein ACI9JT_000348 [Polaribacter sp.]|jgi:hypothetical protein